MSEDLATDRVLPPTPQRRQRARREGHVAKSPQLTAAVMILGMLMVLKALGPGMLTSWRSAAALLMGSSHFESTTTADLWAVSMSAAWDAGASLLYLLLAMFGLAVVVNLAQVGFLLAPQRLSLRFDAVSPMQSLARIFSGNSLAWFCGSLLKLTAVLGVGWLAVRAELSHLVVVQSLPIDEAVPAGGAIVLRIGLKLALVLLALGLLDYGLARWRHEQSLRLSPQDAREEARRMDGDPQLRARRRQMSRQRNVRGPGSTQAVH